ncbi:MAG: helix-turn-helix domain-containing protein [Pseudomonadota bacterium]
MRLTHRSRRLRRAMQTSKRRDTRAALIHAAERLFAEKGLGGVSVRDITIAAGAKNQSALHYHFGGMEALIKEVFAHRFRDIEHHRIARLAEIDKAGQSGDVYALLSAGIAPLLQGCLEEEGRLYARFCVQLISDPRYDAGQLIDDIGIQSASAIVHRLSEALTGLTAETVSTRLRRVFTISVMITADYARSVEAGSAPPVEDAIHEAASTLTGFLLAKPATSQA